MGTSNTRKFDCFEEYIWQTASNMRRSTSLGGVRSRHHSMLCLKNDVVIGGITYRPTGGKTCARLRFALFLRTSK